MSLQASEHFKDVEKERNRAIDQLGKDLQCGVCQEVIVFVSSWYLLKLHLTFCSYTFCLFWFKAVSMNCQHKFCHHCITTWKVNKMYYPICRSPLLSQGRAFVSDFERRQNLDFVFARIGTDSPTGACEATWIAHGYCRRSNFCS